MKVLPSSSVGPFSFERVRRASERRRGITLIEVMISVVILLVAVGGLMSSVGSALRLGQTNEESSIAQMAARQVAEQIQSVEFREIFATFNADGSDDPGGPNTAAGNNFVVRGLSPMANDADGMVGEILFPTVVKGGGAIELRESVDDAPIGMPRDLNGDGLIDTEDHSDDYVLLPITVRLTWSGVTGRGQTNLRLLLVDGS